ncbi:hypothetical protein ANCCAN_02504 [Ancylostoma caninum]|uniref:Uncharacterized protein n=1 Tax=Ancylostoma caninum TaxID=29170 RepID=A0A368H416_ANCCA|nr:hypothetical protein ANCCAN_02504 [Ancylostoma caninum]
MNIMRLRGSLLRPDLVDKQPGDTSNGPNPPFPPTPEPSTGDKKGGVVKSPPTIFENNNKTGAVYNVFLNLDLGKDSKRTRKVLRKLFDALDEDDSETSAAALQTTKRPTIEQPSRRSPHPGRKATPPAPFPSEESDSDYDYKEEPAAVEGTTGLSPLDLLKKSGSALSQEEILTITHPCSTDHKRYIRKREEAGCIGAIAFSTIVCREFLDCMLTEDGPLGKCGPKICTQFKAMPKSGKCFRELFACK